MSDATGLAEAMLGRQLTQSVLLHIGVQSFEDHQEGQSSPGMSEPALTNGPAK